MTLTTCPAQEELRELTIGRLAEAQSDELFDHVRGCDACEHRLAKIGTVDDTLIGHLLDDTDDDSFAVEPAYQLAMAKALAGLCAPTRISVGYA